MIDAKRFAIPSIENITNILEEARNTSRSLQLSSDDMLEFLLAYNTGLSILDNYDHQTMEVETSLDYIYVLSYEECMSVIDETTFNDKGDLFGLEKNNILFDNGEPRISNTTLATLTILVATSNPNDKESIINLIKLILFGKKVNHQFHWWDRKT